MVNHVSDFNDGGVFLTAMMVVDADDDDGGNDGGNNNNDEDADEEGSWKVTNFRLPLVEGSCCCWKWLLLPMVVLW